LVGILASAISGFCTLHMLSFFMGGTLSAGLAVELYGGLAMFLCYKVVARARVVSPGLSVDTIST
jgi:hypothetical protein